MIHNRSVSKIIITLILGLKNVVNNFYFTTHLKNVGTVFTTIKLTLRIERNLLLKTSRVMFMTIFRVIYETTYHIFIGSL